MQWLLKNKRETEVTYLNKCVSFSAIQHKCRTEHLYYYYVINKQYYGNNLNYICCIIQSFNDEK